MVRDVGQLNIMYGTAEVSVCSDRSEPQLYKFNCVQMKAPII